MDVLIIDDEAAIGEAFAKFLLKAGYSAAFATSAPEGRAQAKEARVILLDLKMPGVEGLELLEALHEAHPRTPIIMVTAHGTVQVAVEAMKRGACDFILKPAVGEDLIDAVRKALHAADAETAVSDLYYDMPDEPVFRDPASRKVLEQLRGVAPTHLSVLLLGETGVGKEVFARLLHKWSSRAAGPIVKINCAALPETLVETELFGHAKGAFSGAATAKPGRVQLADQGTLFLDEIGELPLAAQGKLLQFLQDGTFACVGGLRTLRADVRVVAATNRNLEDERSFRRDLYFRLTGMPVRIPPLRERPADIEALTWHFCGQFGRRYRKDVRLAPGALEAICAYSWPGNVRELEQTLERAIALSDGPLSAGDLLSTRAVQVRDDPPRAAEAPPAGAAGAEAPLREQRLAFERARVAEALERANGSRTEAARLLGISRRMLQKKLRQFGIH